MHDRTTWSQLTGMHYSKMHGIIYTFPHANGTDGGHSSSHAALEFWRAHLLLLLLLLQKW